MYVELWLYYLLLVLAGMQIGHTLYWLGQVVQMYRRRGWEPPLTISARGRRD